MAKRPLVLLIRDGWGYRLEKQDNALIEQGTPRTDALMSRFPHTILGACGDDVGLPDGYMGNSEVGHITIGSGRILMQSLARINKAIKDKTFFANPAFLDVIGHCKEKGTTLHLVGLLQREGVHSHLEHLFALLDLCKEQGFQEVKVHVITDGRDAPVHQSLVYLQELLEKLDALGFGEIASLSGRYYTMDRDKRWERTKLAYDALVEGRAPTFTHTLDEVKTAHAAGETDEFLKPRVREGYAGFQPQDGVIFFNFRTDRPRQFTQAAVEDSFAGFQRVKKPLRYAGMTQFYRPMAALVAFGDQDTSHTLGEIVSAAGLRQLRISETEKYAHVTFFFNAEREEPYPGEERILIPSPKVATYDLQPEMSAQQVTDRLVEELKKGSFEVIITNIVNGDMVGHTGVKAACHVAVKVVDECVGRIVEETLARGGSALVFADHGNIEDKSAQWQTSHTMNKVPCFLASADPRFAHVHLAEGGLQDIAPTALDILGLPKPAEMTGKSLIRKGS
jgi:2,3-bisphosphoglycerate-independent phosphoglycerate mutase